MEQIHKVEICYYNDSKEKFMLREVLNNGKLVYQDKISYKCIFDVEYLNDPITIVMNFAQGLLSKNKIQKGCNGGCYFCNILNSLRLRWFKLSGKYKKFRV